ncbi:MAG: homoserine O-succinyltransferase MetX, partial [Vitreimonas sp.]
SRGHARGDAVGPRRWLSLSESIDRCSVSPEAVKVPTTLVACPSDQIVPLEDVAELARRLPRFVALHALPSIHGHDAFLKEQERLGGIVRSFLKGVAP